MRRDAIRCKQPVMEKSLNTPPETVQDAGQASGRKAERARREAKRAALLRANLGRRKSAARQAEDGPAEESDRS
jgi:hypothetical protein